MKKKKQGRDLERHADVGARLLFEAGSYLRFIDSCATQRKTQGLSRACNESKKKKDLLVSADVDRG